MEVVTTYCTDPHEEACSSTTPGLSRDTQYKFSNLGTMAIENKAGPNVSYIVPIQTGKVTLIYSHFVL